MKYLKQFENIDFDDIDEEETSSNDDFHRNKDFYEFLYKHGMAEQYVKDFNELNVYDIDTFLYEFRYQKSQWINRSFVWYDTDYYERYEELHNEWRNRNINESIDFDDIDDMEDEDRYEFKVGDKVTTDTWSYWGLNNEWARYPAYNSYKRITHIIYPEDLTEKGLGISYNYRQENLDKLKKETGPFFRMEGRWPLYQTNGMRLYKEF